MPPKCRVTKGCTHDHGHFGACHVPEDLPNAETTHQVDHKAEALRLLNEGGGVAPDDLLDVAHHALLAALVHSNFAMAEGQERVAEELEGIRLVLGAPVRERMERELADALSEGSP